MLLNEHAVIDPDISGELHAPPMAPEQVELSDLGGKDGADALLPCKDPPPASQTSGADAHPDELSLPVPTCLLLVF